MSDHIPNPDGSSEKRQKFSAAPPMIIDTAKNYTATMVTSKGTLEIVLDAIGAPTTVNSFVFLARWHYYDGIVFHRVIPGFVLQGGDPTGTGAGGPRPPGPGGSPPPAALRAVRQGREGSRRRRDDQRDRHLIGQAQRRRRHRVGDDHRVLEFDDLATSSHGDVARDDAPAFPVMAHDATRQQGDQRDVA